MRFDVLDALTRGAALNQGRVNTQLAQRAQDVSEQDLQLRREQLTQSIYQFMQQQQLAYDQLEGQNMRTAQTNQTRALGHGVRAVEGAGRGLFELNTPTGGLDLGPLGVATPSNPQEQARRNLEVLRATPGFESLTPQQQALGEASALGSYIPPTPQASPEQITFQALVRLHDGDERKAFEELQKMKARGAPPERGRTANQVFTSQQDHVMGSLYALLPDAFQHGVVRPEALIDILARMETSDPQAQQILATVSSQTGLPPEAVRAAIQRELGGGNIGYRSIGLRDAILEGFRGGFSAVPDPAGAPPPADPSGLPPAGGSVFQRPRPQR